MDGIVLNSPPGQSSSDGAAGHRREVREVTVAGAAMLRVDVPAIGRRR